MRKIKSKDNPLYKFWDFMWNGDSILSWITFLVVIFLFIKFIFFPGLSAIFGTALPIVIVESCSMYHNDNFDGWWEENKVWYQSNDIYEENFESFPLKNGFTKGDIFFVRGIDKEDIKLGDVIIFTSNAKNPIIHRAVTLDPLGTKGDNGITNPRQLSGELDIHEDQIIGKALNFKIPLIGWLKLVFFEQLRPESQKGFCK